MLTERHEQEIIARNRRVFLDRVNGIPVYYDLINRVYIVDPEGEDYWTTVRDLAAKKQKHLSETIIHHTTPT